MNGIKREFKKSLRAWLLAGLLLALATSGCAVPQRPGEGLCKRHIEPSTKAGYWLYLPVDYVQNNGRNPQGGRWPMVVTFHGLKPYDNANPQIREWQQEADRYGFIVIAPELHTCDSLTMQFPLQDANLPYVRRDESAVLAIMDEVQRRTDADPTRVLATSFSSGGYMAHFMVNRHPDRFSCLAVRGSNFNANLLNPAQVPKYRDMKIGIFFGQNDFKVCREESMEAVGWYRRHRFDVIAKKVGGLGHERKPEVAAALFADTIGVTPKSPPDLSLVVMMDVSPAPNYRPPLRSTPRRSAMFGDSDLPPTAPRPPSRSTVFSPSASNQPSAPEPLAVQGGGTSSRHGAAAPVPRTVSPQPVTPRPPATPKRPGAEAAPRSDRRSLDIGIPRREQLAASAIPARIRVHGNTSGPAPLPVSLSVAIPESLKDGASILWTDNSRPIQTSNRFETQNVLREPGEHLIEALIITADDQKLILQQKITVLPPASQPADS